MEKNGKNNARILKDYEELLKIVAAFIHLLEYLRNNKLCTPLFYNDELIADYFDRIKYNLSTITFDANNLDSFEFLIDGQKSIDILEQYLNIGDDEAVYDKIMAFGNGTEDRHHNLVEKLATIVTSDENQISLVDELIKAKQFDKIRELFILPLASSLKKDVLVTVLNSKLALPSEILMANFAPEEYLQQLKKAGSAMVETDEARRIVINAVIPEFDNFYHDDVIKVLTALDMAMIERLPWEIGGHPVPASVKAYSVYNFTVGLILYTCEGERAREYDNTIMGYLATTPDALKEFIGSPNFMATTSSLADLRDIIPSVNAYGLYDAKEAEEIANLFITKTKDADKEVMQEAAYYFIYTIATSRTLKKTPKQGTSL